MNRIANSRTNGLLALVSLVWLAISTAAAFVPGSLLSAAFVGAGRRVDAIRGFLSLNCADAKKL